MESPRPTESNNNDNNGVKLTVYDVIGTGEEELARRQYPDDDPTESDQEEERNGQERSMRVKLEQLDAHDETHVKTVDGERSQDGDDTALFNSYSNEFYTSPSGVPDDADPSKIRPSCLEEPEQVRKLFVGGLDYKTSEATLKQHFERFGEVTDCIVMREAQSKRSRGFGFVTYKSSSMVDRVQEARPHKVDGREVQSKRAYSREEAGKPELQTTVNKVYLGGLSDDIEEAELRSYFEEFGNIVNINIVSHKDTGKRRGFAFVEYDDYDPVDKIVFKKFHTIRDKRIEAKKAIPKVEMDARKRVDPRGLGGTMIAGPPVDGPGSRSLGARANDSRFWDAHAASGYPAGYSGPTSYGYPAQYHSPSAHYGPGGCVMHGGQSGGPYGAFRYSHSTNTYARNNYAGQAGSWAPGMDYGGFSVVQSGTGGPMRLSHQHRSWGPYGSGYGSTHRGRGYNS